MWKAKLLEIDGELVLPLPREVAAKLGVQFDDSVFIVQDNDAIQLASQNSRLGRQLASGEKVMDVHSDVLRQLADS
jgi:hypothetical protein